ncbi:methenyltetrahydromethanopterin cyclohydrolase [Candidatus Thorarchaeota archaeon]|jgi:methenyltetrahydromethanopterin cyclohydrolase|nr:MAG: methenyltetrahydromethanopterin cyclohydrolase [Candidatus Thorarchaeota archaeon]
MEQSINEKALTLVEKLCRYSTRLECAILELDDGCRVVDCGVDVPGSDEAGRLIGEICLGGLGTVRLSQTHVDDMTLPSVVVSVENPQVACLASQLAGWAIKHDGYSAMASGPARALARKEKVFEKIVYADQCEVGVIVLEASKLPSEKVTSHIADMCGIDPANLHCIIVPTASEAGSVQISARVVEVGVHKMHHLGFDSAKIKTGYGVAPIAPVFENDGRAMGVTNDCILYGGRTYYFVRPDEDDNLRSLAQKLPSEVSEQYGLPFYDLFKSVDFEFYRIDSLLFSPAEVTLNDIKSGESFRYGRVNPEVLRASLEY